MGCRPDGKHELRTFAAAPDRVVHVGDFNRSQAFSPHQQTCESFAWSHASGAGVRRHIGMRHGPAIVGTDKDIGRALAVDGAARRAGVMSVNLLHLGMYYAKRHREGLWTPCTNVMLHRSYQTLSDPLQPSP